MFINEKLAFIISKEDISRSNDFNGLKVTKDGGKTFQNAKFTYENNRVDIITIKGFPYYEEGKLKIDCSVYDLTLDGNGHQDYNVTFMSEDDGFTWS